MTLSLSRAFRSGFSLYASVTRENGAALVIGLMFLAILALLGSTAVVLTTTDMQIGANYKKSAVSFYYAEAGVNYAISQMEAGLANGSFSLPTSADPNQAEHTSILTYSLPSGFDFSISDISMKNTNEYLFTSTGNGPDNAQSVIEVTFERDQAITFAAFGDELMEMHNSATVYSYDGRVSSPPTGAGQSTHQGDIGSNDELITKNSSFIDGDGVLGEQHDGSPTTDRIFDYGDFFGDAPFNAGRIDPDPLGLNSGGEYDPASWSNPSVNDNDDATDPSNRISLNSIDLPNSGTKTIVGFPGRKANYYLTEFCLKNSAVLTIDLNDVGGVAVGPVRIFLDNPTTFDIKNSSEIRVIPSGKGHLVGFFTNSTDTLDIKHNGDFNGLFYAPNADVVVHNSGDVNGSIWAKTVDIRNSGTLNFNTALADMYESNELTATTWRDLRN